MPTIDRDIAVDTSLIKVWEFISDFRTTEQWDPPTVKTTRESGDGGIGTVYNNTSKILGHDVDIVYTVTEHEPQRRIQLRGETSSMTTVDTIEVVETDAGTTLHYSADFTMKGAAKLAEPLMPLALKKLGDDAEKQIRQCLESL